MGMIISPVEAIENVKFEAIPKNKKINGNAVIVDGSLFILRENPHSYRPLVQCAINDIQKYACSLTDYYWLDRVMKALVSLNVISSDDANKHIQAVAAKKSAERRAEDAEKLIRICNLYGVELTAAQRHKMGIKP